MYTHIGAAVTAAFRWLKKDWALNVQLRHIQKIPPNAWVNERVPGSPGLCECSWCCPLPIEGFCDQGSPREVRELKNLAAAWAAWTSHWSVLAGQE